MPAVWESAIGVSEAAQKPCSQQKWHHIEPDKGTLPELVNGSAYAALCKIFSRDHNYINAVACLRSTLMKSGSWTNPGTWYMIVLMS